MAQRTVGIVGLGIMGGAFAHNLVAAGWRVIGYDIDPKRRRAHGARGRRDRARRQGRRRRCAGHHHQPAQPAGARMATVKAIVAARVGRA